MSSRTNVNVLLFGGKQLVQEEELEDAQPVSGYKIDGKLHEQERDEREVLEGRQRAHRDDGL